MVSIKMDPFRINSKCNISILYLLHYEYILKILFQPNRFMKGLIHSFDGTFVTRQRIQVSARVLSYQNWEFFQMFDTSFLRIDVTSAQSIRILCVAIVDQ